jgi:hypothetical protein
MRKINNSTINKNSRNEYFNMIEDSLIVPSSRAENLQENYFKERAKTLNNNPNDLRRLAKEMLTNPTSPVYFNPRWKDVLGINEMDALMAKIDDLNGNGLAWDELNKAKKWRDEAINDERKNIKGIPTTSNIFNKVTTDHTKLVHSAINDNFFGNLKDASAKKKAQDSVGAIRNWTVYQAIAEAYNQEINRREKLSRDVDEAIQTQDVKALEDILKRTNVKELQSKVSKAIQDIKEAKAREEELKKREEELKKRLAETDSEDEKQRILNELNGLRKTATDFVGGVTGTGFNKTWIFVGIGVVVLLGAVYYFKKKD